MKLELEIVYYRHKYCPIGWNLYTAVYYLVYYSLMRCNKMPEMLRRRPCLLTKRMGIIRYPVHVCWLIITLSYKISKPDL